MLPFQRMHPCTKRPKGLIAAGVVAQYGDSVAKLFQVEVLPSVFEQA